MDTDLGRVTIKHGQLKNLDMPPMTMVFQVADPAMLDGLKIGDPIIFVAQKTGKRLTVTKIEVKK